MKALACTLVAVLATLWASAAVALDITFGEGATSVAEPATLALAVITALGACAVALMRHRSHSVRYR